MSDELRFKIEQKIISRNRQDTGLNTLTPRLLNDIYDYMSDEKNSEKLQELLDDWNF